MKDCVYPDCFNCRKKDCDMEWYDISNMLKRRNANETKCKHNCKNKELLCVKEGI